MPDDVPAFVVVAWDAPSLRDALIRIHRLESVPDRALLFFEEPALRLLAPGGYLLTFSCSGAIGVELFQKIVAGAVVDAGVEAQLLRRLAAGEDHPLRMTHPEGEYLKGLLLQRL